MSERLDDDGEPSLRVSPVYLSISFERGSIFSRLFISDDQSVTLSNLNTHAHALASECGLTPDTSMVMPPVRLATRHGSGPREDPSR